MHCPVIVLFLGTGLVSNRRLPHSAQRESLLWLCSALFVMLQAAGRAAVSTPVTSGFLCVLRWLDHSPDHAATSLLRISVLIPGLRV